MEWNFFFTQQAEKFLARHHLPDEFALEPIRRAIRKLMGGVGSVDLKKTSGKWAGCYRVRVGKVRIIFSMDFDRKSIFIEVVDNRGSAYK
jgi:mRNA interferase RelE/StbE